MCGCNSTLGQSCYQCSPTVHLSGSNGCAYTINTDCVIFNEERLSVEPLTIQNNSARNLTSIIGYLDTVNTQRESKIITGSISTGPYTLVPEDATKILLLKYNFDDAPGNNETAIINLPIAIAFANKTFIFKNISLAELVSGISYTVSWTFNRQIQYQWSPSTLTSNSYNTLDDANFVVKLTFVKIDTVNYDWIVI